MKHMNKPLTIYKASAGSGKTFRLAVEYIKLVVNDPSCYRQILAVTFTNKATEEMKLRILCHLYGIAHHLPDSMDYMDHVTEELGISEEQAAMQAGKALMNLIHNYHYFRVETIDTFFQSVLRNLAHELELPANLRIELNDYQIEEQAVDELIESLDSSNKILFWILDYIKENISDDKSWNIFGQVKRFGRNIFTDVYKKNRPQLRDTIEKDNFFGVYTAKLKKLRTEAQDKLSTYAESFFEILESQGFAVQDLANGEAGAAGYFIKLRRGEYDEKELLKQRVVKAMDDPMSWLRKADQKDGSALVQTACQLSQLLMDTEKARPRLTMLYKSADITLRHLNQLRLLSSIERKVHEMNEEANRFLLSDTQILLHALINDSDSPFIFEKIGTQLEHIMIDEFQDTSLTQWQNFKILLKECMSHENATNLIVGDVKQSIYRWRSGDWRLLNNIEREFPLPERLLETKTLRVNYRSERNIVRFNNAFFQIAARMEDADQKEQYPEGAVQLERAYNDEEVVQEIPAWKQEHGSVRIELIPQEDYQHVMMDRLKDSVLDLLGKGIRENEIAVIVRFNQTIRDIADFFMQNLPDVKLVSDEAFSMDASLAVNMLINAMTAIMHPDDHLTMANLAKAYQRQVLCNQKEDNELFIKGMKITDLLPEAYVNHFEELLALPLSDLAERLYAIFRLDKIDGQSAYICKFFDILNNYLQDHPADIDAFINDWNESLHIKTIQSDELDGIRLITIHKSKGLEFGHVIMPFCDWKLEKGDTLWCSPQVEPFNELPLVPVYFSEKQMKGTIYEKDYQEEHLQNTVDNLNLLYVAFTRARRNLIIFGKRGKKGTRSYIIEKSLEEVNSALANSTLDGDLNDPNATIHFAYGTLYAPVAQGKKVSANVFNIPSVPQKTSIRTFENQIEFRQSNKSREFTDTGNEEQQTYIQTGNVLHRILSTIRTTDDIDQAIRQLEFEGILDDNELTKEKLQQMLRKRLADPRVASWFAPRWKFFNECTILHVDPNTDKVVEHRPDRVITDGHEVTVIDYKFGHPRQEYHEQVSQYMQLLSNMGYRNIKGYLWYVYSNKIEAINS